jgi:hypothetical protein
LVCQTVGGQFFLFCQNYMNAKLVCQTVWVTLIICPKIRRITFFGTEGVKLLRNPSKEHKGINPYYSMLYLDTSGGPRQLKHNELRAGGRS